MSEARWNVPESWMWARAADIARIVGGGTPPSKDETNFAEQGIPWITPADLTKYEGTYISRGRRDLSEKGYSLSGAQMLPEGTVLFSSRAPIGYCVISANEISTSQGFKSLVLEADISPEFVRYYLLGSKDYAESLASGTTFLELSGARVADMAVPVAPLPEQRRIVAKIDSLSTRTTRARNDLARIPALVAKYKARLLESAYSGKMLGDASITYRPLEQLVSSLRYGTSQKSYETPAGVPVLRIPNVSLGKIDLADLKYSELSDEDYAKLKLDVGDLLVVRSNGSPELVGRPAVVSESAAEMAYAGYLIRLRPRPTEVLPEFLSLMLQSPQIRKKIEAEARSTSGVHNVNARTLAALQIPAFDVPTQAKVVEQIENAFTWLDRISVDRDSASRLLAKIDAAILAKAFRGELMPQDPLDEPAAALLKRNKAEREKQPRRSRGRTPRVETIKGELMTLHKNLEQVLIETDDWVPAQTAFQRCGIGDGAQTEDIERIYAQLRDLDTSGRLETEVISDNQGRKLYDRIRLRSV
jgi:type I restriction enzyme, S subunit